MSSGVGSYNLEEIRTYAGQGHGYVAAATPNIDNSPLDVTPRKTISQFGNLTIDCQRLSH